jgi:hypothetical protein
VITEMNIARSAMSFEFDSRNEVSFIMGHIENELIGMMEVNDHIQIIQMFTRGKLQVAELSLKLGRDVLNGGLVVTHEEKIIDVNGNVSVRHAVTILINAGVVWVHSAANVNKGTIK